MTITVVITGATGMVGKAVLLECLESPSVESILVINRRPLGVDHPKLKEVLHSDFSDFSRLEKDLADYDACFYCMGVSSFRMSEADFTRYSFDYTKALADAFYKANPNAVFNYVSGAGCDSSEKGRVMWARVKGRTENYIFNRGFKDAYAFRPGAIFPVKGVQTKTKLYDLAYKVMTPFYPLLKKVTPIVESDEFGKAMINSVLYPQKLKKLENKDLIELSKK